MTFPLIAAMLALLACALVGRAAAFAVGGMRPPQAVVLLAVAALAVSLASGLALMAIAVAPIATLPLVASQGQWSAATMRAEVPAPGWLGAFAALAVGGPAAARCSAPPASSSPWSARTGCAGKSAPSAVR